MSTITLSSMDPFAITAKSGQMPDMQIGWWSGAICGRTVHSAHIQTLTFTFTQNHQAWAFSVAFDDAAGEYAADFDIRVYDAGNGLIKIGLRD